MRICYWRLGRLRWLVVARDGFKVFYLLILEMLVV